MTREALLRQINAKRSMLCVGLDTDPDRLPAALQQEDDPVFTFNRAIIDATHPFAVAYKPNLAFYEARGTRGWQSLERTMLYLRENYPDIFTIADAKRGDIGNTAAQYARAFFDDLDFDAVTLSPYMGRDTIAPFLKYRGKWVIVLAITSNPGARDFQHLPVGKSGRPLFAEVLRQSKEWGTAGNTMYVAGATRPEDIAAVRQEVPEHFLLVPGIGAQGGDLAKVIEAGAPKIPNLLINSSRGILYASGGGDYARAAAEAAKSLQEQINSAFFSRA